MPQLNTYWFKLCHVCVITVHPQNYTTIRTLWCFVTFWSILSHCSDVIMDAMASQITSLTSVYSIVYTGADQRKHQSSVSLVFVRGIHRSPVNSPHKWPVTQKIFPFDDVIMHTDLCHWHWDRPPHDCPNAKNIYKITISHCLRALTREYDIAHSEFFSGGQPRTSSQSLVSISNH